MGTFSKPIVCAVIVTYNPDISRLKSNVSSILPQINELLIVDNGSENINEINVFDSQKCISVISLEFNAGIAYALNCALKYCKTNNIEFLITLDQDSIVTHNMVGRLTSTLLSDKSISMVGPYIKDINVDFLPISNTKIESVYLLITSGALCRVAQLLEVGGFDEKLFIDCVDFDMSLKLIEAGFSVMRDNNAVLDHEIGKKEKRKILFRSFYILNHPPIRVYYMVRNRVFIMLRYYSLSGYSVIADFKHLFTRTLAMMLYEKEKKSKLIATFKGFYAGFKLYRDYRSTKKKDKK